MKVHAMADAEDFGLQNTGIMLPLCASMCPATIIYSYIIRTHSHVSFICIISTEQAQMNDGYGMCRLPMSSGVV